jgi:IclR family pca regulon transcriptional regulator
VSLGYLKKNPDTRRYQLTPRVLELGFASLQGMSLRSRVLPYLLEAARKFKTTTACSVLDRTEILYIERVRSHGLINLDLSAGSRLPVYCTAMGKAILAFLDSEKQRLVLEKIRFKSLTPYTITDKALLIKDLKSIKKRGYAFCRQEMSLGLESIGAPIFNSGLVEAAISFNLPGQPNEDKVNVRNNMISKLISVSKEVSIP